MPILLTTPYHGFTQVKAIGFRIEIEDKIFHLSFQYGDTVDSKWVPGDVAVWSKVVYNKEAVVDVDKDPNSPTYEQWVEVEPPKIDYDVLIATSFPQVTFTDMSADPTWTKVTITHPTHGDLDVYVLLSYVAVAANIYQYALTQGWFEGTIV